MSRRRRNLRQGVSLTELLVLMSLCAMILSMSGMLLHRVMRIDVDSRLFVATERSCSRLDRQFREDIHEATSVNIKNATPAVGEFLVVQLPYEQTVTYSRSNGGIERIASRKGKVASRDEFAFQSSSNVELREEESPRRVIFSVTSPLPDQTNDKTKQVLSLKAVPIGLLVEACVGRNEHAMIPPGERESVK